MAWPACVTSRFTAERAMPKSISFTSPAKLTMTLCGEMSRWTMCKGSSVRGWTAPCT